MAGRVNSDNVARLRAATAFVARQMLRDGRAGFEPVFLRLRAELRAAEAATSAQEAARAFLADLEHQSA